jgi:ABC-type multidrug transport system fused ATPase/permease subunit
VIAFKDVSVAYNGRPALSGVTLALEPGALCVLVGPSGSGKSTLLGLLQRLYEPIEGEILIDGQPLKSVSRKACTLPSRSCPRTARCSAAP